MLEFIAGLVVGVFLIPLLKVVVALIPDLETLIKEKLESKVKVKKRRS